MQCPRCSSTDICALNRLTVLGHHRFRCRCCRRWFNERAGTVFNFIEYPTELMLLVVRWRLRYTLSLRGVAAMFLERGFEFTHDTVRDWRARFAPMLTDALRRERRGLIGASWYVDET